MPETDRRATFAGLVRCTSSSRLATVSAKPGASGLNSGCSPGEEVPNARCRKFSGWAGSGSSDSRKLSRTAATIALAFIGSKLIGVLFERYSHELSARPHSGLLEKALQDRLHVALGNLQLGGDLLVGKPFQHETQDFPLPLVELRTGVCFAPGGLLGGKVCIPFVERGVATRHQAHALNQRAERTLFQKDAGNTLTDQPARLRIAHPGGDDQDT